MTIDRSIRPRSAPVAGLITKPFSGPGDEWQQSPRTAAEMAAAFGGRTPAAHYPCQELSGNLVAAFGGTADFVPGSYAGDDLPAQGQPTPYAGWRAVEARGGASNNRSYFKCASEPVFQDSGTSYAWLLHVRLGTITNLKYLLGQSAGGKYDLLRTASSGGHLEWILSDGAITKSISVALDHANTDTWVWVSVDRAYDLSRIHTRLGSATVDISALGMLTTSVQYFTGLSSVGTTESQYLGLWFFNDVNAEGDPSAEFTNFQRYADA